MADAHHVKFRPHKADPTTSYLVGPPDTKLGGADWRDMLAVDAEQPVLAVQRASKATIGVMELEKVVRRYNRLNLWW